MKTLSILILMVGFSAHAGGTADAAKGAADALKAGARGGKAALDASKGAATMVRTLKAVVGMILEQTTPRDIGQFRAELDKVADLDGQAKTELIKAFQVAVIDQGCIDAKLTGDAYKNLSLAIHRAVEDLYARQTNVVALATLAKMSDMGTGDRAKEIQLSDESERILQNDADMVRDDFGKLMKKSEPEAVASLQHLGARCGYAKELAARTHARAN